MRGSNKGLSLVEVMIGAALLGAIALGIGSLMRESAVGLKRNKTVSIRRRLIDQYHDIARGGPSIQNTVNANAQLAAHIAGTPPPGGLTNMGVNPPTPLYDIELRDGGDNVVVPTAGLFLNRNGGLCNPACDGTNGYWIVQSTFAAKAGSEFEIITTVQQNPRIFLAGDPMFDPEEQRLKTELSTSSAGTAALAQWVRNGTRIENINPGEVRVLTNLRSSGTLRVDGATTLVGNTRTNGNFRADGTLRADGNTTLNAATRINSTLDVTGASSFATVSTGNITTANITANNISGARVTATNGIRVENTGAACNAGNAGLVRYNTGTNVLEYCNGSSYVSALGGASSEMAIQSTGSLPAPIVFTKSGGAATSYIVVQGVHRISGYDTGGCTSPATFQILRDGNPVATSVFDIWNNPDITIATGGRVNGLAAGTYTFTVSVSFPSGSSCGGGVHRYHFLTVREVTI